MVYNVFDIETYKDLFVFCSILYDDNEKEIGRNIITVDKTQSLDATIWKKITQCMNNCDIIISYNGKMFDLPILEMIGRDVRDGVTCSKYIHADANAIINNPRGRKPKSRWAYKHFDLFNNCLMSKSLKQWEMYCNLPIQELPYEPTTELDDFAMQRIIKYCQHDVECTAKIFFKYGNKRKSKYQTLPARIAILNEEWHSHTGMDIEMDRTALQIASGIIYGTAKSIPPITLDPLKLFNVDEFDVPQQYKDIIRFIAKNRPADDKAATIREYDEKCTFNGIKLGLGGCHYVKKGRFDNVYAFDVASQYPRTIKHWGLLKTDHARKTWVEMMNKRMHIKSLKGTPEYNANLDLGYKILVLNALSGGFRIQSSTSPAFDPAAGEAMCFISQLVILELAFSCKNFDNVIEINTDSVFVIGEENAIAMREKCKQMYEKYDMLFEEDFIPTIYFKDVNNYAMYDKNGALTGGKGYDYSDVSIKGNEKAVSTELFANLLNDKFTPHWEDYDLEDFIVKWHKSSSSRHALLHGNPPEYKNYYMLWTKKNCPNSGEIQTSATLMDSAQGLIKSRWGVFATDIKDFEQLRPYIDYKQYQMDLDCLLLLWGRDDLVETKLGNARERKEKGVPKLRTFDDVIEGLYPLWAKYQYRE